MPILTLTFPTPLNTSVQIGDVGYFVEVTTFTTSSTNPDDNITTIDFDANYQYFIMFAKNNAVNLSSVLGYYAKARFVNNSMNRAELFSVGSEVQQSSK